MTIPPESRHLYDSDDDSFSYQLVPWYWKVTAGIIGVGCCVVAVAYTVGNPDVARRTLGVTVLITACTLLYHELL